MKFLIAFFAVFGMAYAIDKAFVDDIKAKIKVKFETCAKEVGASDADLNDIFSKKMPSTHEGKCIMFCFHKQFNVQHEDGTFDLAAAQSVIEMVKDVDADLYGKMVGVFNKCAGTPPDADPCIFAIKLAECVLTEGQAAGINDSIVE